MAEPFIWLAAACALFAAICGDRAAWALLASLLTATAIERAGVPFNAMAWAGIDVIVCGAIIQPPMPKRNVAIVLLFLPAWGAYFMPETLRYWIPASVVIAQFVLTLGNPVLHRRLRGKHLPTAQDVFNDLQRVKA